jgi:hypothetical protein
MFAKCSVCILHFAFCIRVADFFSNLHRRIRSAHRPCLIAIALVASALAGCGGSPITSTRVEQSVAPTFANLVQTQVSWMGLPPMPSADVRATARCRRLTSEAAGAGDWTCTLVWLGPQGQSLRDTYDLFVATDGCYTASVAGEALGGPTLKTKDRRDVRNLLYAFDGCFDTT